MSMLSMDSRGSSVWISCRRAGASAAGFAAVRTTKRLLARIQFGRIAGIWKYGR